MSQRFFTADFHFGSSFLIKNKLRPFRSVSKMNETLIRNCNMKAAAEDTIIHIGDLCQFWDDRGTTGCRVNPRIFTNQINADFFNVLGNHDPNNRVKSICSSMRTSIGRFKSVSVGHYPSYDPMAKGSFHPGDVRLCGHVHNKWKYFIDEKNLVLNINCGVDVWNFNIISEDELSLYITKIMYEKVYNSGVVNNQ